MLEKSATIVLVHGFGIDSDSWREQLKFFSRNYHVHVLDIMAPDEEDLLGTDYMNECRNRLLKGISGITSEPIHFVGQSVSGILGLVLSMEHSDVFRSVSMICSSPCYINKDAYHGGFGEKDVEDLFDRMAADYLSWVMEFSEYATQEHTEIADYMASVLKVKNPAFSQSLLRSILNLDYRHLLRQVEVPSLILALNDDPIVPVEVSEYMNREIPGSRLVLVEGTGHHPHMSYAQQINEALSHFFDTYQKAS